MEKILPCSPPFQRPGEREAAAIQREFEWKSRLRGIHNSLERVDEDLKKTRLPKPRSHVCDSSYDGFGAVNQVEEEVKASWDQSKSSSPSPLVQKLHRALKRVTAEPPPIVSVRDAGAAETNVWTNFAKAEVERKACLEASYNRFRMSEPPAVSTPDRERFSHHETRMTLPSGAQIDHPVATLRDDHIPVERYTPSVHAYNVGVNTGVTTESFDRALPDAPHVPPTPNDIDRQTYVSKLVASRATKSVDLLYAGRRVRVQYYGIYFEGTILNRNIGPGTFSVKFDDGAYMGNSSSSEPLLHTVASYIAFIGTCVERNGKDLSEFVDNEGTQSIHVSEALEKRRLAAQNRKSLAKRMSVVSTPRRSPPLSARSRQGISDREDHILLSARSIAIQKKAPLFRDNGEDENMQTLNAPPFSARKLDIGTINALVEKDRGRSESTNATPQKYSISDA